jgi:hypothetical protein
LVLFAGEVVRRFDDACHAAVEISPPGIVGRVHAEGESRIVGEFEVDLAVFARIGGVRARADAGGEVAVEVC